MRTVRTAARHAFIVRKGSTAMTTAESGPFIVAGVDGSEESKLALRWALRQAELTGARLYVVSAWQVPIGYGFPEAYIGTDIEDGFRANLRQILHDVPTGDVPVSSTVINGVPAAVLVDASRGADLLVVGSRGHGAFAGLLLGSVSGHCVSHAHCPVTVVRAPRTEAPVA